MDELEPIPKEFYSFETGAPFTKCIDCHKDLMDGEPYLIEKAIKNHREYGVKDTVFDYALCMSCADQLRKQISKKSMEAITRFFAERTSPEEQFERLHLSPDEAIQHCMITGKAMDDCAEYQIYALCINDCISSQMPPYMISGEVMDELLPLLSPETTDELNGFFNKHFAPDPSLMEPIGPKLILV